MCKHTFLINTHIFVSVFCLFEVTIQFFLVLLQPKKKNNFDGCGLVGVLVGFLLGFLVGNVGV